MAAKIAYRYVIVVLVLMATCIDHLARVNLNVAIVSMVRPDTDVDEDKMSSQCPYQDGASNKTKTKLNLKSDYSGRYDWSPSTQGAILGSFYISYVLCQIPTGRLAEHFGGKWIIAVSLIGSGLINLVTPQIASSVFLLTVTRVILGVLQGGVFTSAFAMITNWFPQKERCFAFSFIDLGATLGNVIGSSIAGYMSQHGFAGGWPSAFYVSAIICLIGFAFWTPLTKSLPDQSPFVSSCELTLIRDGRLGGDGMKTKSVARKMPWRKIFSSGPFLALLCCKFMHAFSGFVILTKLPAYLDNVLHISSTNNGLINSLMPFTACISVMLAGYLSEAIIQKQWIGRTNCRKLFLGLAAFGQAASLLTIPSLGCNIPITVLVLVIGRFCEGFNAGGLVPVPSEMSRNFPATVFGILTTFSTSCGLIAPYLVGLVLESNLSDDLLQLWSYVFYTAASLSVMSALIFIVFGSAERQSWDMMDDDEVLVEEGKDLDD